MIGLHLSINVTLHPPSQSETTTPIIVNPTATFRHQSHKPKFKFRKITGCRPMGVARRMGWDSNFVCANLAADSRSVEDRTARRRSWTRRRVRSHHHQSSQTLQCLPFQSLGCTETQLEQNPQWSVERVLDENAWRRCGFAYLMYHQTFATLFQHQVGRQLAPDPVCRVVALLEARKTLVNGFNDEHLDAQVECCVRSMISHKYNF